MGQSVLARLIRKLKHWARPPLTLAERYPQYQFGEGTYDNGGLSAFECGEGRMLSIGAYTSIAGGVKVFLGCDHRMDWVTTFPFNVLWEPARGIKGHPASKGDVVIGSDVWIGMDAVIMAGIRVGDGAVIGARAVVSKDVPPYAVVVGNPARVARYRFDAATIEQLLEIKWWEWDKRRIEKSLPALLSSDITHFIDGVREGRF